MLNGFERGDPSLQVVLKDSLVQKEHRRDFKIQLFVGFLADRDNWKLRSERILKDLNLIRATWGNAYDF